jgi:hypothetical protein
MNPANLGSVPEYKIDQRSQTYFNDRNASTINHDRVRVLCLELESLTVPYRDPTGQIIQLWKSSRYGLVGAVLMRSLPVWMDLLATFESLNIQYPKGNHVAN